GPTLLGSHHQGPLDLRTSASATEGRTRSRSLRGAIVAGPSPSRPHDNDCLCLPPASPPRKSETGKKESTDHRLNQACQRSVTPSPISCFDRLSDARTAEDGSTARRLKQISQSSARTRQLKREIAGDVLARRSFTLSFPTASVLSIRIKYFSPAPNSGF